MEDNPFPGDDYLPPYDLPTREPATPEQAVGSTSRDQEITRQAIDSDPVAKQNLQSILAAVKDRILPDVAITVSEMETFLDKIYDEWQPRNLVPTPIRPKPKRSAQECSYEFGTFRQTASASYTERGLKRPSSGSRHRKRRATAPPSTLPDRQMGQPARLTVIYNRGRHPDGSGRWIWFSLQDRQNKHVELTTPCNYTACSREDAYLRVMQRHDSFMRQRVHVYNLQLAVDTARHRIAYWSQPGNSVGCDSPYERKPLEQSLAEIFLCRNAAYEDFKQCPEAAKIGILNSPAPTLF